MNQAQRNFLIKKIEDQKKAAVNAYESAMPDAPNLSNFLFNAVMNGTFEIKSNDEIKEMIKQKALKSKKGHSNWMASGYAFSSNDNELSFKAYEFFIVPDSYKKLREEYLKEKERLNEEIRKITIQSDTLITRIQLASDKTLQTMINEVDDMGNISLMDSKLKLLSQ